MDIRNGEYSFDEIFKLTSEYQKQFDVAAENTILPSEPDMEKVEDLLMQLYSTSHKK